MADVTVSAPQAVDVIMDHGIAGPVHIPAGLSIQPEEVANHWYAIASGVEKVKTVSDAAADLAKSVDAATKALKAAQTAASKARAASDAKPGDADLKAASDAADAAVANAQAALDAAKQGGAPVA